MASRKPYPSDVSDEEWAFVAPYLALVREDAPQRTHDLREVLNGLRWVVRTGSPWRYMPHDFPPWEAIYQQTQRWIKARVFEGMVHDLRALLRLSEGRTSDPSAAILDARTLRSTPESGHRAGYDGHKGKKGSKVHAAVDTLGHLLALLLSPANEQERAYVGELAHRVQEAAGESALEIAFVDQGYTGERPSA
jgi:transposase